MNSDANSAADDAGSTKAEPHRPTRIAEMDILRGAAITAVVGLHAAWNATYSSDIQTPAGHAVALLFLLCGFGVPLFLTLSTAGLARGHSGPSNWAEHVRFLVPRISRLLPAYVVWSLLSAAFFRPEVFTSLRSVMAMLVRGTADAQFYFVRLLIEVYVLWPLFRPLARVAERSAGFAFAIPVIGMFVALGWARPELNGLVSRSFVMDPIMWLGYLAFGVAAAPILPRLRSLASSRATIGLLALCTAAAALAMDRNFYEHSAPSYEGIAVLWASIIFQPEPSLYILSAMGLLALLAARFAETSCATLLTWLGSHSYGIFLVHLLVLRLVLYPLLPPEDLSRDSVFLALAPTLLCWIAALGLSAGLTALLSRYAWTRPLISNRW